MENHQKNPAANGKILYYLSENFRYPENFRKLLYVSQILQGMAMKYGVDHWRRHRGRCMGTFTGRSMTTGRWHPGQVSTTLAVGRHFIIWQKILWATGGEYVHGWGYHAGVSGK